MNVVQYTTIKMYWYQFDIILLQLLSNIVLYLSGFFGGVNIIIIFHQWLAENHLFSCEPRIGGSLLLDSRMVFKRDHLIHSIGTVLYFKHCTFGFLHTVFSGQIFLAVFPSPRNFRKMCEFSRTTCVFFPERPSWPRGAVHVIVEG